jgi:XrtJ-associated TM-motif-TM protein
MINARHLTPPAVVFLICAASVHAQTGCTDSPEAPTAFLMLVGAVGIFYGSSVLRKLLSRIGSK